MGRRLTGVRLFGLALLIAPAIPASAHPGHNPLSHGMDHLLTSPYHLMMVVGIGCGLFASALWVRSRGGRLSLRITGGLMVAATAVVWVFR